MKKKKERTTIKMTNKEYRFAKVTAIVGIVVVAVGCGIAGFIIGSSS